MLLSRSRGAGILKLDYTVNYLVMANNNVPHSNTFYFIFQLGISYSSNWDPNVYHMNSAHVLCHKHAHERHTHTHN